MHTRFKAEFKTILTAQELLDNSDVTSNFDYEGLEKTYNKVLELGNALKMENPELVESYDTGMFTKAAHELLEKVVSIEFQLNALHNEKFYSTTVKQIAGRASKKLIEITHVLDSNILPAGAAGEATFSLQKLLNEMQESIDNATNLVNYKRFPANRFTYLPPGYALISTNQNDVIQATTFEHLPGQAHGNQHSLTQSFMFGDNDFTKYMVIGNFGAFLIGGVIFRPLYKSIYNMTVTSGSALFNAASYAYSGIQRGMNFILRPAGYQAVPVEDIVIEHPEDQITASNNILIQQIDSLVQRQPKRQLLTEEEIEIYKGLIGLLELEKYIESTKCALLHKSAVNPITIDGNYQKPEGQPGSRSWAFTVDAEALKQFINQCTIDKKHAFAPTSPGDLLNQEAVSLSNGFSYKTNEADLLKYAAAIKEKISFWRMSGGRVEQGKDISYEPPLGPQANRIVFG